MWWEQKLLKDKLSDHYPMLMNSDKWMLGERKKPKVVF